MTERTPQPEKKQMESRREKSIALARELSASQEIFPFPGINPEAYSKLKADIARDEGESGYTTAMFDELVERFKNQGMKVVLGKFPESGNVFILPSQSSDIENDSIFPRHLQISEEMDDRLKEFISLQGQMSSFQRRS